MVFGILVLLTLPLTAQTNKEPRLSAEPLELIDLPTAGMLYHKNIAAGLELLDDGGLIANAQVGLFDRVMAGISYGGTNVLGDQKLSFNPSLGLAIRVRVVEETFLLPAFVAGFSSQGKGPYSDALERYSTKSPGFYIAASKNFSQWGYLSLHAGTHYSLEDPHHKTLNLFAGVEKTFASVFSGLLEYDNGFTLQKSGKSDKGRGLLNFGIRASISNGFLLGFNIKDMLKNQQSSSIGNRTIILQYAQTF